MVAPGEAAVAAALPTGTGLGGGDDGGCPDEAGGLSHAGSALIRAYANEGWFFFLLHRVPPQMEDRTVRA